MCCLVEMSLDHILARSFPTTAPSDLRLLRSRPDGGIASLDPCGCGALQLAFLKFPGRDP